MMRDLPHGADLLAQARQTMADAVLPSLDAKSRYQALLVMRAMELAEQEFRASPEDEKKLVDQLLATVAVEDTSLNVFDLLSKRIRNGDFDASDELYAVLRQAVAFKLKDTNPQKAEGD